MMSRLAAAAGGAWESIACARRGARRLGAWWSRVTIAPFSPPWPIPPYNVLSPASTTEDRRTLREGRVALDLRVTSPHPSGGEHLIWATRVLLVLLGLTEGVAMDPATQSRDGRVDLARVASNPGPLAHVVTHAEPWGSDAFWLHTHGVQKFGRPEVEIVGVPRSFEVEGRALLADLGGAASPRRPLAAGQEVDLATWAAWWPWPLRRRGPPGSLRTPASGGRSRPWRTARRDALPRPGALGAGRCHRPRRSWRPARRARNRGARAGRRPRRRRRADLEGASIAPRRAAAGGAPGGRADGSCASRAIGAAPWSLATRWPPSAALPRRGTPTPAPSS